MPLLRIKQFLQDLGPPKVELHLTDENGIRKTDTFHVQTIDFSLKDQESIRWYLEDYLQYPEDPAPLFASNIEKRIVEIGNRLFEILFQSESQSRNIWEAVSSRLNTTRIEIVSESYNTKELPWELLRDPQSNKPIILLAQSFVYSFKDPGKKKMVVETEETGIRVLFVISRPGAEDDVPFRSVANRLFKNISEGHYRGVHFDVLRPPTFKQLKKTLIAAKEKQKPYHIVHFDGHGIYTDLNEDSGLPPKGKRGYVFFEKPSSLTKQDPIHGTFLGEVLQKSDVKILILNACRSAHGGFSATPDEKPEEKQIHAFGSFAQEVVSAGVPGVVAMRFNVYIETAIHFVADVYSFISQGRTLGDSVAESRKNLTRQRNRHFQLSPRPLQDWLVPVVYEPVEINFSSRQESQKDEKGNKDYQGASPEEKPLGHLPAAPSTGFIGRHETLYALDRAFDQHPVVLLHAYAGSGKTTIAVEFAHWYYVTGGLGEPYGSGLVLFSRFDRHKTLLNILNEEIEPRFSKLLERQGIHWFNLPVPERRKLAISILQRHSVLWIFDNVESIAGFPEGGTSLWSAKEQTELVEFIKEASKAGLASQTIRFLITSRREEQAWLGNLPHRIAVPPMSFMEQYQFTYEIAKEQGYSITNLTDWFPLLNFSQGNPLTIKVLAGQSLKGGLKTREQFKDFVDRLKSGDIGLEDMAEEGILMNLKVSLDFAIQNVFNEDERKMLALLYLFRGFVQASILGSMGHKDASWCLEEVKDWSRNRRIALLDKLAEVGLLTAYGKGNYLIHPALTFFFANLFKKYYSGSPKRVKYAFVRAMDILGNYGNYEYLSGNRDAMNLFERQKENLLYACELLIENKWWQDIFGIIAGLGIYYSELFRFAEWKKLIDQLVVFYFKSPSDEPVDGLENEWELLIDHRIRLAMQDENYIKDAERLQKLHLKHCRKDAKDALKMTGDQLLKSKSHRSCVYNLAYALRLNGDLFARLGSFPESINSYKEAMKLYERINEKTQASNCALGIAQHYRYRREFSKAEEMIHLAIEYTDKHDGMGLSFCYYNFSQMVYEHYTHTIRKNPDTPLKGKWENKLREAEKLLNISLYLTPYYLDIMVAQIHHELGNILNALKNFEAAVPHFQKALRYYDNEGNISIAVDIRVGIAIVLFNLGRTSESLKYLETAVRYYNENPHLNFDYNPNDVLWGIKEIIEKKEKSDLEDKNE